jgi:putative hemolysin
MAALNTMGEKIYIDIIGEKTRIGMLNSTYRYCGRQGEAEQLGA